MGHGAVSGVLTAGSGVKLDLLVQGVPNTGDRHPRPLEGRPSLGPPLSHSWTGGKGPRPATPSLAPPCHPLHCSVTDRGLWPMTHTSELGVGPSFRQDSSPSSRSMAPRLLSRLLPACGGWPSRPRDPVPLRVTRLCPPAPYYKYCTCPHAFSGTDIPPRGLGLSHPRSPHEPRTGPGCDLWVSSSVSANLFNFFHT